MTEFHFRVHYKNEFDDFIVTFAATVQIQDNRVYREIHIYGIII